MSCWQDEIHWATFLEKRFVKWALTLQSGKNFS